MGFAGLLWVSYILMRMLPLLLALGNLGFFRRAGAGRGSFWRAGWAVLAALVAGAGVAHGAYTFQTLDVPDGVNGTSAQGIEGGSVVGYYLDGSGHMYGFFYDGANFTKLDAPDGILGTQANGLSLGNIVGTYYDGNDTPHGFIFDGTNYTTVDYPGNGTTELNGIAGTKVAGSYEDSGGTKFAFFGNVSSLATIDFGDHDALAYGISGVNVAGSYFDIDHFGHGFVFNGTEINPIDPPLGSDGFQTFGSETLAISGRNLVGTYKDADNNTHGYVYNGTGFLTFEAPGNLSLSGVTSSTPNGISGTTIVGSYLDGEGDLHGYVATFFADPVPVITKQPANVGVLKGKSATFEVVVSSTITVAYQWQFKSTNIPGATKSKLTIPAASSASEGPYRVLIAFGGGNLTSHTATLTIQTAVKVVGQPSAASIKAGGTAKFTVRATGSGPLTYQWQRNGVALKNGGVVSGATAATLKLTKVAKANAGTYRAVVSNLASQATSANAKLTVLK